MGGATGAVSSGVVDERRNAGGEARGAVYRIDEVCAEPQAEHLGLARPLTSEVLGEMRFVRQPMTLTRTPSSFVSAAPGAGAQTDEILAGLGYDDAAIARLRDEIGRASCRERVCQYV